MAESTVTVEEIKKHDREDDCWIVVNDTVWDITDFIPTHPGGNESEHRQKINVSKLLTCNSHNKACGFRCINVVQFRPFTNTHLQDS